MNNEHFLHIKAMKKCIFIFVLVENDLWIISNNFKWTNNKVINKGLEDRNIMLEFAMCSKFVEYILVKVNINFSYSIWSTAIIEIRFLTASLYRTSYLLCKNLHPLFAQNTFFLYIIYSRGSQEIWHCTILMHGKAPIIWYNTSMLQ